LPLAPALFVMLWSTGFIGARLGVPHADPLTFLAIRFTIATGLMALFAFATGARWPKGKASYGHAAVAGLLLHAAYLGGVFVSIDLGMAAAVSALIVGLQPLVTAVLARRAVGEVVRPRQWGGLLLGLAGVVLVLVGDRLVSSVQGVAIGGGGALAAAAVALAALTGGTLYQKRYATGIDLRVGATVQFGAAMLALWTAALAAEPMHVAWTAELVFALAWLIVMLSFGAVTLLMLLIRHGAASRVSSLFYLVPPATAVEAWLLFDQKFGPVAIAGMVVAALGVGLVVRSPA
jgi:drug/metabolite transporter (DMT)-like permease